MGNEGRMKVCKRLEGEPYPSKNLITERNRRNRIKERLFTLRALVPKITKMDKASTLGDAIDYIEELQGTVKMLQDEVKELEDSVHLQIPNSTGLDVQDNDHSHGTISSAPAHQNQGSSSVNGMDRPTQVEVEVNKIGAKEFNVRVCCEQRKGLFGRLMEAMSGLGFLITDVNVVTLRGKVSSVLNAEANCEEIQAHQVREMLLKLSFE
ncbi:transcription factor ABORTED MICROSPORES-like [Macadamia integrifolia]|uniref:transcription factor ABORTED MICROSPORES-like n=1 Tax=Macadamia integrifolia TaxID=60698 RepID=UPI001C4F05C1|nr:transcription factor ABORTED MICROSPORES-like [Macadamia integrifolia]XP_042501798.1 transcription factor ABORTED MICROSPORES-like [Macadamia integrifolia]XP_042501799.1 transcription factor ABORTED MICROSPORES-like [Macadamia integrifolia]XP_042501800.1 transcription factor ABORTED MICROSPORES-like [Macadamia integrifolia]XP_042501801.1 transcription factor ABORTED MICROSPORES-like [Macadamia integrifolia]XP_042501802.1 transcription factor ABORTED MICROSPORES-like [Macadamia integrifolia]